MADYSDGWRQYLEIEDEVPDTLEVLARFHTHICSIPVKEDLPLLDRNTSRYGGSDKLFDGYVLEGPEIYVERLEEVREGEGFQRLETTELYLHLGTILDDMGRVRSTLKQAENSGATPLSIRELSKLTGEAIERKLQEAVQQET